MTSIIVPAAAAVVAVTRVQGRFAAKAFLRLGVGHGTCDLDEATVAIVTEQGVGRCFYYPYRTYEEARQHFRALAWKPYARILYSFRNGVFLKELKLGGVHLMPIKTIRNAAMRTNLVEKVFARCGKVGWASYHFVNDRRAYVSYASEACSSLRLDDGSPLPTEKYFEDVRYSRQTRTFRGVINWSPTSFCGDQRWEHEIVFDEAFENIIDGQVHHFTPSISDRSSKEQVLYYRDTDESPNALRYCRWHGDNSDCKSFVTSAQNSSPVGFFAKTFVGKKAHEDEVDAQGAGLDFHSCSDSE